MVGVRVLLLAFCIAAVVAEPCKDGQLEAAEGEDCNKFRSCIGGKWLEVKCPPKQVFHPSKALCVNSSDYNCTVDRIFDICLDEGRRFAVDGCSMYDECQSGKLVRKECGRVFSQFSKKHGRCIFVWPWHSCKPQPLKKCKEGEVCETGYEAAAADKPTTVQLHTTQSAISEVPTTQKLKTEATTALPSTTTEGPTTTTTTAETKCQKGNRKPDLENCKKYQECNNEGKWVSKSCFWFWHFDHRTLKCKFWHSHCDSHKKNM